MPETIISHLAAQADAITAQIDVLESEPTQVAADGQTSIAWGDGYFERSNTLQDSQAALTESISHRPATDLYDAFIQLQIALRTLRIVNGSDTSCPMTEKAERLIVNALPAVRDTRQ